MWNTTHTEFVRATAQDVWQRWINVSKWPEQDASLKSAELIGPFEVGNTIVMQPAGSPTVQVRLVEVTPNASFSSVGSLPLATLRFDHRIEPAQGGVQFTQSVTIDGSLAWLWSRMMGKTMASNLEKRMKTLAQLIETKPIE